MDQYFTSVRELGAAAAQLGGVGAQAQAGRRRQAAGGHRRRARVRAQDAADVRRDEAGAGDRFDADHLAVHRHHGDSQHHAPRQPARSARRACARRKKASSTRSTASSPRSPRRRKKGESLLDRTMVLYGTLHGQRELALEREPARAARRRRLQARPAPGVRHSRTTTR